MYQDFIEKVKEYKWQLLLLLSGLCIGGAFLIFGKGSSPQKQTSLVELTEQVSSSSSTSKEEGKPQPSSAHSSKEKEKDFELVVDVKGAVKKPGVYQLKEEARVQDAIQLAGGLADNADPKSVNLAQKVTDEAVVYVATKEEGVVATGAQSQEGGNPKDDSKANKVNLNTATEADLQTISGIGAKRAADIIAYREENGKFKSIDDLKSVSGIGDKTLENLRPHVTVD